MRVIDLIHSNEKTAFSFEILPPLKGTGIEKLCRDIDTLREFDPKYINITTHRSEYVYKDLGNGLFQRNRLRRRPGTVAVAAAIQNKYNITVVPHILCSGFTREETEYVLLDLQFLGITDLLVLRGDKAKHESIFTPEGDGYHHAIELQEQINNFNKGIFVDGSEMKVTNTPFSYVINKEEAVLQVRDLLLRYGNGCECCRSWQPMEKNRCPRCGTVWAVRNVSFDVYPGEVLGIVGESGSGKSSVMKSLYFDHEVTGGSAFLKQYQDGKINIFGASSQQRRYIKNHLMGMVYQNPLLGLRMDYSSAANVAEKIIAAGNRNVAFMDGRTVELLEAVEILTSRRAEPPRNFSGGMQQRVQISKALANNPGLLLLDEVTTGLDLSVQAKVLDLIRKIRSRYNISIILVSHDLAVIRMLADRTMVMLDGQVVESGLTDQILEDPQHAYTQQLVHSLL